MFQNYLKIALRNLQRNKLHSIINILGLSLGIAVVILIFLFVQNELSQDKWHKEEGNIYRLFRHWGDKTAGWVWSPPPMVDLLEAEVPEVMNATGLLETENRLVDFNGKKIYAPKSAMVDSTYFMTIPQPFLFGNHENALETPSSLVISQNFAEKLFGTKDPIGETVKVDGSYDYQISGVVDGATKTHLKYDMYMTMPWQQNDWLNNQNATYIRLTDNADLEAVEQKIYEVATPHLMAAFEEMGRPTKESEMSKWGLQPIEEVHLYSRNFTWNGATAGDIRYLTIFLFIGFIVLLVAIINYMNLATARVSLRAREVGVRKVSGAQKKQLISQFLTESILQSLIALVFAMMIAEFLLPVFNSITDRELSFVKAGFSGLLFPLIGLGLIVGLLAGVYPAFVLAKFQPVKVLKGVFGKTKGAIPLRKVLVVSQFSISIALIIVMSFVFKQVNYMLDQDLGFDSEQVLVVPLNMWESKYQVLNRESAIRTVPGVQSMALSSMVPGERFSHYTLKVEGHEEPVGANLLNATSGFDETLGLELVEGRFLDEKNYGRDTINNFVVNETFVKRHGIEDPIGKSMGFLFDQELGHIVGVVKDFHQSGLQNKIAPLAIVGRPNALMNVSMKVSTNKLKSTIKGLENVWTQIEPDHPMRYSFLDADFANQYAEQERFGTTMLYATLLTIFIAMLGLFGLASFTAERRTKEIGIRKVLGASVEGLIGLLVKDFIGLVVIAGGIAIPAGYFLSKSWLEDFAYQTTITASPFLLSILLAVVLTILTVGYQGIKTSLANPIKALKHE